MMNGVFVIDKAVGVSSQIAINRIRKASGVRKIGHCGTLDPLASGVLPVMIGSATKACDLLMDHEKTYTACIRLGLETDSEDITGTVLHTFDGALPSFAEFAAAAQSFIGEIRQVPPMYSALKKDGQKLVDLARKGISVEREARTVTIHSIRTYEADGKFYLDVRCSRGTYIRTLCADIGRKLGCGACMESLRRTSVGMFTIEQSTTMDDLRTYTPQQVEEKLIPLSEVFSYLPKVQLPAFFDKLYRNGEKILLRKIPMVSGEPGSMFRVCDANGFYSIGEIVSTDEGLKFKSKMML